jgi:hypothetical protein
LIGVNDELNGAGDIFPAPFLSAMCRVFFGGGSVQCLANLSLADDWAAGRFRLIATKSADESEGIMDGGFSVTILLIDYILGAAMWTLIGRFGMSIFVSEHSDFFFMRAFVKVTDPMIKVMAKLTPAIFD